MKCLCEDEEGSEVILWVVEAEAAVESGDGSDLLLGHVEVVDLEVGLETLLVVGLWNDSESTLSRPSEENLSWGLVVLLGDGGDGLVLEENWGVLSVLPSKLDERSWAEGRVGGDGDSLLLSELDEGWLDEVWVVLCNMLVFHRGWRDSRENSPIWRTAGLILAYLRRSRIKEPCMLETPMFLTNPSSTSSSIAAQVSWSGAPLASSTSPFSLVHPGG